MKSAGRTTSLSLVVKAPAAIAALLVACMGFAGCTSQQPVTSITEIAPSSRVAKPSDCFMPVLYAEPKTDYQKVAIVEGWGAQGQENQVLQKVQQRACETGADALLIVDRRTQADSHYNGFTIRDEDATQEATPRSEQGKIPGIGEAGHPGYYLDTVAIIYTHGHGLAP